MLSWAFDEHNFSLRFTSSFQQDFQKSYDALIQLQDWMRDGIADRLNYEKQKKWLDNGVMYAAGRDKQMRPILYVSMERFSAMSPTVEDILGVSDYIHAYLTFNAMVPGTIE